MTIKKPIIYIIIGGLLLLAGIFVLFNHDSRGGSEELTLEASASPVIPEIKKEVVAIEAGDTYGVVMARTNISQHSTKIYEAAKKHYDLAQIRAGYELELIYGYSDGEFRELVYKIDTEEELSVVRTNDTFQAELRPIPYEVKIVTKEGEITSSLYEDAMRQNIDERAIIGLADIFQWTIDFAMDPRVGDTFRFIYEERYLDGEYVRPGRVLAGKYVNEGKRYTSYYFDGDDDNTEYFDEDGNSAQKMFLKAPIAFKYISSGFTTGMRYVEAFNVSTGHRAIDYAASAGTPIRSVGDGTILSAGWNGSYGYMVSVRHNGTYTTNYAHMSRMAVKKGNKVKQGDIIGYVGSTGFSTGPHLHYEMVKNGVKVNSLAEVMPPGKALSAEMKEKFLTETQTWREELDK
ncbi:MAG: peptidoglycan DD-metalloendopeptidase family protein [bacterium]|nr:peptidoglycan DD-metalloendopeptidase family protein [bacterium]